MPHRTRRAFVRRHPAHVTLRVLPHVWSLRSRRSFRVLRAALSAAGERLGMRVVEFSVQGNHLHFVVEADGHRALSRGMQGLALRIAKGLNRMMGRRGRVLAGRYHVRALWSSSEAVDAIRYVRWNHHIHASRAGRVLSRDPDEYSSAVATHGVSLSVATTAPLRHAALALVGDTGPPYLWR